MKNNSNPVGRVIGFDSHPDSFTAAVLRGQTPAQAIIEKTFHKVPMAQLSRWAKKHTKSEDLLVLEASGNSFQVVRSLRAVGRRALVLESCQLGKLKDAHANNDKLSAVRIGKAYLAGTAKEVWLPDEKTTVRGGFGIYYDRSLFDFSVDEIQKLARPTFITRFDNGTPTTGAVPWNNSYLTADTTAVSSLVRSTGTPEVFLIDNKTRPPKSTQFSLGLRRVLHDLSQLPDHYSVAIEYDPSTDAGAFTGTRGARQDGEPHLCERGFK